MLLTPKLIVRIGGLLFTILVLGIILCSGPSDDSEGTFEEQLEQEIRSMIVDTVGGK